MSDTNKRKLIGAALAELVEQARTGGPRIRIGLMAAGSELGSGECLAAARLAMEQDTRLQVVGLGPITPEIAKALQTPGLEWLETPDCEADISKGMEQALADGTIAGAVALHYPFPVGVTTIGRVQTPGRGKAMLIASSTGASATHRPEAMLRNTLYGIAVAKALGQTAPSVGILNLDAAPSVQRALVRLQEKGYDIHFGSSVRADGGALLRGNDLLAGAVDVCVCDTLTGNVLMKLFAACNTGGSYEATGWGYGPSAGENWNKVVSIISRASGAPVIANALLFNAMAVRGDLPGCVVRELRAAKAAGLDEVIASLAPKQECADVVTAPPAVPTDAEIHGIDVLDLENAVRELWKASIYAESAMGCTGPVVKLAAAMVAKATEILKASGYL
ncbi:MAG: glycine/sarcosine/betaine reductase complex component C subunit alpha [Bilophila sp.]